MKTLVIVSSHKGNTRRIADAIAEQLLCHGSADVVAVEEAPSAIPADIELLVIGSPTEGHGMTPEMRAYLDGLAMASLRNTSVAAFDTRLGWPRILSGSAGDGIAARLKKMDARVLGPVGSFIVSATPELAAGELERAGEWAESIADRLAPVAVPA